MALGQGNSAVDSSVTRPEDIMREAAVAGGHFVQVGLGHLMLAASTAARGCVAIDRLCRRPTAADEYLSRNPPHSSFVSEKPSRFGILA